MGVLVCTKLETAAHCSAVCNKLSQTLALLKRIFGRFTETTIPIVINTYIRPTMEYALQAWSPWLQKDIELLQRVYHRATKLVKGLRNRPYEVRIEGLNFFDLHRRSIRSDLILMYSILRSPNHPLKTLFKPGSDRTSRRHRFTVEIPATRVN